MNRPELILLDLDPVLLQGDGTAVPHVAAAVDVIRTSGASLRVLTNDSLHTPAEVAASLEDLGLPVGADEVVTAAQYLAAWVSARSPRATVYLLGSAAARELLERAGLRTIGDPEEIGYLCDYIVAGAFPDWSYDALVRAYRCYTLEAVFVSIENEPVYQTPSGPLPAGGVTTAALTAVFGRGPRFCAGMPNAGFIKYAVEGAGKQPAATLLISDARRDAAAAAADAGVALLGVGTAAAGPSAGTALHVGDYAALATRLREVLA